jgi:hypothetical protein
MKKPTKLLLGLATLWPFSYLIFFFVTIFSLILFMPSAGEGESDFFPFLGVILPLHLFTMLSMMALIAFYIVNVFRNDRVEKDKKVLWTIVLFMGNMIAMPVYWYLYIWRESPAGSSSTPPALREGDASGWANDVKASNREHQYVPPSQPPDWR